MTRILEMLESEIAEEFFGLKRPEMPADNPEWWLLPGPDNPRIRQNLGSVTSGIEPETRELQWNTEVVIDMAQTRPAIQARKLDGYNFKAWVSLDGRVALDGADWFDVATAADSVRNIALARFDINREKVGALLSQDSLASFLLTLSYYKEQGLDVFNKPLPVRVSCRTIRDSGFTWRDLNFTWILQEENIA